MNNQVSPLFSSTSLVFRSSPVDGHLTGQHQLINLIQRLFTGDVSAVIDRFLFRYGTRQRHQDEASSFVDGRGGGRHK